MSDSEDSAHSAVKAVVTSSTRTPSPVRSTWRDSSYSGGSFSTRTEPFPAFDQSCELAGQLENCPQAQAYNDAFQKTIEGIGRLSKLNEHFNHPCPLSPGLSYCCGTYKHVASTIRTTVSSPPGQLSIPERETDTVVYSMLSFPGLPKQDGPNTPRQSSQPAQSTEIFHPTAEARKETCLYELADALNTLDVSDDVKSRVISYTYDVIGIEEILYSKTQQNDIDSCCCGLLSDIPILARPIITYLDQMDTHIGQQILTAKNANAYIRDIYLDNTALPCQRFPKIVRYVFRNAPKHRTADLTILERLRDLFEVLISNNFFAMWDHQHGFTDDISDPACVELHDTLATIGNILQHTIDGYTEFIGINQDTQDRYITPLSRQVLGAPITWELEQRRYWTEQSEALRDSIDI